MSLRQFRFRQFFWSGRIGSLGAIAGGTSTKLFLVERRSTDLDSNTNLLGGSKIRTFHRSVKTSPLSTFSKPTFSYLKLANSITTATEDKEEANESSILSALPRGIPPTFSILNHATIPADGVPSSLLKNTLPLDIITRLQLTHQNLTLPTALMMITAMQEDEDEDERGYKFEYTSQSKARKDCRRGVILIHRGPLGIDAEGNEFFHDDRMSVGRVGDRVYPGDVIAIQTRMTGVKYINSPSDDTHHSSAPFHLPVVYQDDYFAIVNKPEGVVVFGHKNGGYGRNTVKSTLPYALDPPKVGTFSVMRRASPVHRLDRATSGLLVVAKTKPAMQELSRQFKERRVKKTYTAIVSGKIQEPSETSITSKQAQELGVCIENSEEALWQIIDDDLENQSAVTIWRPLKQWPLEHAWNNTATMVELKPKTGRYHQLRRHMAWISECPILGDKKYDGGGNAKLLRENGLFLCSNKVTLEHPYFNTANGRKEWVEMKNKGIDPTEFLLRNNFEDGKVRVSEENGVVYIHAEINLPDKFYDF